MTLSRHLGESSSYLQSSASSLGSLSGQRFDRTQGIESTHIHPDPDYLQRLLSLSDVAFETCHTSSQRVWMQERWVAIVGGL